MINDSTSRILIYGVGLMGSSLALGIKNINPSIKLDGIVRSLHSIKICEGLSMFDRLYLEEEFLSEDASVWDRYDLIVFGTPVHLIKTQVKRIPTNCRAIITDMGSTKETIIESVESNFSLVSNHRYVSSHPMCGSENSGAENAIQNLFQDKLCIITSLPHSNQDSVNKVIQFWNELGMKTFTLDGKSHDRILAYLSHSPHILSSLMVMWAERSVGIENKLSPLPIMGGGFKDMSRIAGSNPEMWQSIVGENQKYILESLKSFREDLDSAIELIENGDNLAWKEFFQRASESKDSLFKKG